MRLSSSRTTALAHRPQQDFPLWDKAGTRPSLDLQFADRRDLVDATTGTNLVDFTRASSGTYVGSDGLIKTATTNLLLRSEEFDSGTYSLVRCSVSPNLALSPNQTFTADAIVEDTSSGAHILQADGNIIVSTAGVTYTYSWHLKAGERTLIRIAFGADGGVFQSETLDIDLTTGVLSNVANFAVAPTVEDAGNGWYRVIATVTAQVSANGVARMTPIVGGTTSYTGDGSSKYYIWGAQLEQSSTVGEYVKTTSTINSAPRFDHDPTTGESLGLLVEESRTNLVLQSQALTTSPWLDNAATTSVASTITDIFGGTSASFKLTEDNTNSGHFVSQAFTLSASTTYSVTAWFKQGSANRDGRILLTNAAAWDGSSAPRALIEFSTGTVQSVLGFTSTNLVPYSNGWYKFTGTALTSASGGTSALRLFVSDGTESYQGDGTSYVYVGPCQLEEGSFPTSYIPTEGSTVTRAADVAGIYDDNFGVFRTNLLKYSEEFDQAVWSATAGITVTTNQEIAPNGTLTADKITFTGSSQSIQQAASSLISGATYVYSVYIKGIAGETIRLGATNGIAPVNITLDGTWQRFETSGVLTSTGTTPGINTIVGTAREIFVWGAQLEQGSTATDYIKSDVNWTSRASNATYYDVNGTLKKSSYNLLLQSEDFSTTWSKSAGVSVTLDSSQGEPFSGAVVSRIDFTAGSQVLNQTRTYIDGTHTASIWIKGVAGETIQFAGETGTSVEVATLTGDWQKLSQTFTATASTQNFSINTFNSVTARTIYITAAQLETGTAAGDYAKTTTTAASTPRTAAYLPDGNGNFVSAGPLLLEAAGTNLLTYSEDFSNAIWSSVSTATITTSTGIDDPQGTNTAATVTNVSGANLHRLIAGTAGTPYTYSVWLRRRNGSGPIYLVTGDNIGVLVNVTNEWTRVSATNVPTTSTIRAYVLIGNTNDSVDIWGAQLEQSSYPTSYIPTTTSTATRAADVSTSAATTVFESDWYRQEEGTMFAESTVQEFTSTIFPRIASLDRGDGSANFIALVRSSGIYKHQYSVFATIGQAVGLEPNVVLTPKSAARSACVYKTNDFISAVNGILSIADTFGSPPTSISALGIGMQGNGTLPYNGTIRRLVYWGQRLPNSTLQAITQ